MMKYRTTLTNELTFKREVVDISGEFSFEGGEYLFVYKKVYGKRSMITELGIRLELIKSTDCVLETDTSEKRILVAILMRA